MALWTDPGTGWERVRGARVDQASDAFLCCPGPSLAAVPGDLRGVNRVIYALNTAYPHIRPDVWLGTDRVSCFDRRLWWEAFPKIARYYEGDTGLMRHCPNVFYADIEDSDPAQMFLRRDHDVKFVWPRNTLIFAVHYIIWSGVKRLNFVGCDMGGARDYHDDRELTEKQRGGNRRLYQSLVGTLGRLTPLAARHGITLRSCTPDSPLNAFMPFMPLDAALRACAEAAPAPGELVHSMEAESWRWRARPARSGNAPVAAGSTVGATSAAGTRAVGGRPVVLVLRSGGAYRPEHVARLVRQLRSSVPAPAGAEPPGGGEALAITVLTDLPAAEFPAGVRVVRLKHGWPGWWAKMELYSPELPDLRDQPFLYLDLDTTVHELPGAFFE